MCDNPTLIVNNLMGSVNDLTKDIEVRVIRQTPGELFIVIAPEFKDIDYAGAITVAEMQIATNLCGNMRPLLVAYLAAHILTIANPTGVASGALASVTEGGTSIAFKSGQSSTKSTGLSSTKYGDEYDRLSRGCIMSVRTRDSLCNNFGGYYFGPNY